MADALRAARAPFVKWNAQDAGVEDLREYMRSLCSALAQQRWSATKTQVSLVDMLGMTAEHEARLAL